MDDIDITADLLDGSDGALADAVPANGGADGTMITPDGTVGAHQRTGETVAAHERTQADLNKPTSLRDQLSNAFKEPEVAVASVALTQDADGKWRMPDGTFASTGQIAAFQTPVVETPTAATVPETVLQGMTTLEQEQFKSLPAEIQQYVGRTMEDLNNRQSRYGEYDLIEQMIGPRREPWQQNGMTPAVALNQLFAMSDFATRDPGGFVLWYAEQQQIDLDELLDERDAQSANVDPAVARLTGEVQQLKQVINGSQQQQSEQAQTARLTTVQKFMDEKDGAGKPLRPYLAELNQEWGTQIAAVRAANPQMADPDVLQKAYDNACTLNPAVRGKIQQERVTQEAARIASAKAAGSSITGSAPAASNTGATNPSNLTLRQDLERQFAEAAG